MAITINDVTPLVSYVATAGQTVFAVPFEFFANTDLVISKNGSVLTLSSSPSTSDQYSATGANVSGGGSITLGTPGAALNDVILIYRDVPVERSANYPETGPMAIAALNTEQAKHIAIMQQLEADVGRSVKVPRGDPDYEIPPATTRANSLFGWDGSGAFTQYPLDGFATSVAFATARSETFAGDGSQTVFALDRTPGTVDNCHVYIDGVRQAPFTDYSVSGFDLTFTTAPYNGGAILVTYSEALTLAVASAHDVSFSQSGAGAVSRTVQAKLRDTVSVLDFGAVIDGTTDATTAFQNAINTGKDVILSPGTMVIGLVTMANNNQRIIGTRACTIRHKASTAGNLFTITGASCSLIGFSIDGNRANQTYAYNNREVLVQGANAEIRGLRITNAQSMGIGAVGGAVAAIIADNDIETCGDFGIFVNSAGGGTDPAYGLCENNLVQDFGISGGGGATPSVGIGIRSVFGGWVITGNRVRQVAVRTNEQLGIECWTDSNNMVVVGNYVDMIGHGEFGLSITGIGSLVSGNIVQGTDSFAIEVVDKAATVTGNIIRSPRGIGIALNLNGTHPEPGDIMSITGNVIENTVKVTGSNAGISVDGDTGVTPIAITISGNTVHGLSHGIVVTSLVTGCTITGNTCYNTGSGQAGILPLGTDMTVSGNTIVRVAAAGTGNGGGIVMGGSGHLISGNRISGNSRIDNAILVNVGATNCVIDGNFITGANSNTVFCNATGSSIVVKNNVGNVGYALQTANRAFQNLNTSNGINVSQQMGMGLGVFTVATLPASAVTGTEAYVTDANATTFNSVVTTGGSNKVPVTYDGAAWRIG